MNDTVKRQALLWWLISLVGVMGCMHAGDRLNTNDAREYPDLEDLSGVRGKAFQVNTDKREFELLKETVIDPQTDEGRSRHTVQWTENARFIKVIQQNGFMGLEGAQPVVVTDLDESNAQAAAECKPFAVMQVTVLAVDENAEDIAAGADALQGEFTADPQSDREWGGTLKIDGHAVPMRLRGPRARVTVRTIASASDFAEGFWETKLTGAYVGKRFVATQLDLFPLIDPRNVDDVTLPRVLVIGDSISMNYHDAAKTALKGIANYYRIEGNGGPTTRGLQATELWLGNYWEEGLGWDLIQFNFGLHDLRQAYDPDSDTFGDHQVSLATYKANLERIIRTLRETGATLMWCTTTPVPQDRTGRRPEPVGHAGRQKDEDLVFNAAALQVIHQHPYILVNDLNTFVRQAPELAAWREQDDVHFWRDEERAVVGQFVAEQIKSALAE